MLFGRNDYVQEKCYRPTVIPDGKDYESANSQAAIYILANITSLPYADSNQNPQWQGPEGE